MLNLKNAIALCASLAAISPAMACYTVYGSANQVLYAGAEPPINMSYQIHQRLPAVFPGGHMVFRDSTDCTAVDSRATTAGPTGGLAMSLAAANAVTPASSAGRKRTEVAR